MANFTAKDYVSDWYKDVPMSVTDEQRNQAIEAIEKILENDSIPLWLDIVRLHRKIKPIDNENLILFVETFRKYDSNFPLIKNENIIHALAGISLCFLFEQEASPFINKICMAAINTYMIGKGTTSIDISLEDYLLKYLAASDERVQSDDDNDLEEDINILIERLEDEENTEKWEDVNDLTILKSIKALTKHKKLLSEETNILWWLFGSYSKVASNSFSSIGPTKMILYGAKELSTLTVFNIWLSNSPQLLNRALLASNDGKVLKDSTLFEVLKGLNEDEKSKLIGEFKQISNLTPCLLAIQRSQNNIVSDEWSDMFKRSTGINLKKKVSMSDLADQVYKEFIFLKTLES